MLHVLDWFVVFDRMAALQFEVLPKRLNKANLVISLCIKTKRSTLAWPDLDTTKMGQAMPKRKLCALAKMVDEILKGKH